MTLQIPCTYCSTICVRLPSRVRTNGQVFCNKTCFDRFRAQPRPMLADYPWLTANATIPQADLTGRPFGRWTVRRFLGRDRHREPFWECQCICGPIQAVSGRNLRSGKSTSCGCFHKERVTVGPKYHTHGHTRGFKHTPTYTSWLGMNARCYQPTHASYHLYGAQGVTVCDAWRVSFETFLRDMGERPSGHSLDRYPNYRGNYEPGNCRWATPSQQLNNTAVNVRLTFRGETHTMREWEQLLGFPFGCIKQRIAANWPVERALTQPLRRTRSTRS